MKKLFFLFLFTAFVAIGAKAQSMWCLAINHSSYTWRYSDAYFDFEIRPNVAIDAFAQTVSFPFRWEAEYFRISPTGPRCVTGGWHYGPIGTTTINTPCPEAKMVYSIFYEASTQTYYLIIDFYNN